MHTKSFWDEYDEIMQDDSRWCYFSDLHPQQTSQDLFTGTNALSYIKSTFIFAGKSRALDITYDNRFEMDQYRSNHTLSAYLLGILLQEKLHIDMRELPKLTPEPKKNFLYFWSLTCLYHDYAFSLETASEERGNEYIILDTLEKFIEYFNIKYSLLDNSDASLLIRNYYNYAIREIGHVDHGIAGAMLFYNAMLMEYNNAKTQEGITKKESFTHDGKRFSKDFEKHMALIANTIAKHNMWYATPEVKTEYEQYGLSELIPTEDGLHLVSLDVSTENGKEKLLFLLGLVDTIEPIKNLGRDTNKRPIRNPYLVLEKIKIRLDYNHKKIIIICPTELKSDYFNNIKSLTTWMNVSLTDCADRIEITILNRSSDIKIVA